MPLGHLRPRLGPNEDMTTSDQFLTALRSTLNHLYDPDRLRQSPLAVLFGVAERFDTPSALQNVLVDAIESLRPTDSSPSSSEAWTTYEVLVYRYVQQLSQQAVADQLGFNVRHLRRKQRAAIETLAWRLWQRYDLTDAAALADTGNETPAQECPGYQIDGELAWLESTAPAELANLGSALETVLARARPLADQAHVTVETTVEDSLPALRVNAVALRQIILNILCLAIHRCTGGSLSLESARSGNEIVIAIHVTRDGSRMSQASGDDADTVHLARRMAEIYGGSLTLVEDETTFAARLRFPVPRRTPILALDDNQDFLQLLERYVADTNYRVVPTRDPDRAVQMAKELEPGAVLLDVMMPDTDGWEVLARLRQHPTTGQLPIIVCTILPQEDLAVSLGADAFLRKPLTQEALLSALDAHAKQKAPTTR